MPPQRLDFGDALSIVGRASHVFVVIGLMRQTALARMIGKPGARQLACGGLVAIVQELDQGERAAASCSRSEIMEERAGMNDQRTAVADPPIAFTGVLHGPTRLFGDLHEPTCRSSQSRLW